MQILVKMLTGEPSRSDAIGYDGDVKVEVTPVWEDMRFGSIRAKIPGADPKTAPRCCVTASVFSFPFLALISSAGTTFATPLDSGFSMSVNHRHHHHHHHWLKGQVLEASTISQDALPWSCVKWSRSVPSKT